VKVKYAVMYKIPDAAVVKLYREFKGDAYQTLVDPRLQEALKQVTALHNAEQLVQNRDQIRTDALLRLKALVGDMITIVDLSITNVDLSDQLEHAIEQKMVKQQESLAKRFELDKERQEAEITLVKAKAEAESIQVKAKALAESPNVIDLEIIKKWNGVSPSTVVVGGGGKAANVVLPLNAK
jgi:prohibitin 2